jgi:hypothetical protein
LNDEFFGNYTFAENMYLKLPLIFTLTAPFMERDVNFSLILTVKKEKELSYVHLKYDLGAGFSTCFRIQFLHVLALREM